MYPTNTKPTATPPPPCKFYITLFILYPFAHRSTSVVKNTAAVKSHRTSDVINKTDGRTRGRDGGEVETGGDETGRKDGTRMAG